MMPLALDALQAVLVNLAQQIAILGELRAQFLVMAAFSRNSRVAVDSVSALSIGPTSVRNPMPYSTY